MRLNFAKAGLAGLAFSLAAPAPATVYTLIMSGTLDSGTYNVLGLPDVDLAGQSFQIVWSIDDDQGIITGLPPEHAFLYGGSDFGFTSPVRAQVTVGPTTGYFDGNNASHAERYDYLPADALADSASYGATDSPGTVVVGGVSHFFFSDIIAEFAETDPSIYGSLFNSIDFDGVPARAFAPTDTINIHFVLNDIVTDLGSGDVLNQVFFEGLATNVSLEALPRVDPPPDGVPEPASWAMMIAGIALTGAMIRRARVRVVAFS